MEDDGGTDQKEYVNNSVMRGKEMNTFNDIGIKKELDWERIRHLYKIGIFAGIMVLIGDMLLGWGVTDMSKTGLEQYFSRYLTVSDKRIFWSALLGLIGIPLETLSWFAIYRLIAPYSEKQAHLYRSGIIGMLMSGALVHVLCCATIYHFKALYSVDSEAAISSVTRFAGYFLVPATVIMSVFFVLLVTVQIQAFSKGNTPYPKWCWVFTVLFGFVDIALMRLAGNHSWAYALSTGWISIGNLWMLGGLLVTGRKHA